MNNLRHVLDRRQFSLTTLAAAASVAAPRVAAADGGAQPQRTYAAFIKFLQPLGYDELADQIAALGFQGVEATVRTADGYIKPAEAAQELPKFQRALARRGLEITILTTDFLGVDQPHVESTLRAAADAGVGRYRLGFYRYDLGRPIEPQLDEIKPAIDALAALNRRVGIGAVYQNHCGADFVGATFWDLHRLLADVEPGEVGCVYDLRHAVVEAGEAWPMLYGLIKPHVTAASVKDFAWGDGKSQHVPLGEGRTPRKFYTDLAKSDFAGPISLHVEYLKQDHPVPEHLAALKRDLATLRKWMDG